MCLEIGTPCLDIKIGGAEMLNVLIAGLPISAKEMLSEAMNKVFDGTVEVIELTKENLRSRVRLSSKSVETVLVVLDDVSSDICKDIENGLYSSGKYFCYTSDSGLAEFLNNKYGTYGLDIVVPTEVEEIAPEKEETKGYEDIEKLYEDKLAFKEGVIKNLECRIKELSNLYGDIDDELEKVSKADFDSVKEENIRLNNELLDKDSLKSELLSKDDVIRSLEENKKMLEGNIASLNKKYSDVVSELSELKVNYSRQVGLLHDKDTKIEELEKENLEVSRLRGNLIEADETITSLKKTINSKDAELGDLRVDLQSKSRDSARYLKELDSLKAKKDVSDELISANATIESLRSEIATISSENDDLKKSDKDKDRTLSQLSETMDSSKEKIADLEKQVEELTARVKDDNDSLSLLNKEKLELQSKLSVLEETGNLSSEESDVLQELQDLKGKVASMNTNPFTRIGLSALPNSSIGVKLLGGSGNFNNIKFAFAGSSESRKVAYRCLLEEFRRGNVDDRYLLVDLVSETSVDYVFEIKKVVSGIEWFRKGGSVQPYISNTILKNTNVLSVGLGYINDSYFLCIDWVKRLMELDRSGYKVVLFCGDISNVVGRVLHESFASFGKSSIYVQGNAIGCRSIITNLRGLSNAKDSVVEYYDYNPALDKFLNMVSKTNECKILTTHGNLRR